MTRIVGRPGAIGSRKQEIHSNYDTVYGKDAWRFVWKLQDRYGALDDAVALYDDSYHEYFKTHMDELKWIAGNFENVYDNHPSNVNSACDYTIQEYGGNHFQDIAIRRCVRDFGLAFTGTGLLEIRMKGEGKKWSPATIPFHKPELIVQPEFPGWWQKGSVESFYQSNKYLSVDTPLASDCELYFVSGNKGKHASAQRSLGDTIRLGRAELAISEEQETITKVAEHKARVAYSVLCKPVLCDDSALVIPKLGGYPGPHAKRELEKNGIGHFLGLAREHGPLSCYFEMTLSYFDEKLPKPKFFTSTVHGTLIPLLRGNLKQSHVKSDYFGCIIPQGHDRTLAEFSKEDYAKQMATKRWDEFREFYHGHK